MREWAVDPADRRIGWLRNISQTRRTPGAASLTDGFPPLTMTQLAAGGIPPCGQGQGGSMGSLRAYYTALDAQRANANDNAATLLLLGGTALLNGYNQAKGYGQPRPPMVSTSCTTTNGITNCLSY